MAAWHTELKKNKMLAKVIGANIRINFMNNGCLVMQSTGEM